jgi:uncharacterized membrane protein
MELNDISFSGGIHTFMCVMAMLAGTLQMIGRKGTAVHARCGDVYFLSMAVANTTALFIFHGADVIFRSKAPPVLGGFGFGFFHWVAVVALLLVLLGRLAASRQRLAFFAYAHPICMILSYWLLIGGAINEAFVRVQWVRQAALAISPGAHNAAGYALLYIAYGIADSVIVALLIMAITGVRRYRRQMV